MGRLPTEYADLGDLRMAFRRHGSGPVLLLLHGNSQSKRFFSRCQKKHFPMYTTIAVDSRGHGESRSEDPEYSIDQYSEDVIGFCRAKGISEARLIGYSDGGNIALLLARKAPDIFRKIVAISPNYLVSGTKDGSLRTIRWMVKLFEILAKCGLPTTKAAMRFRLMLKDIGITEDGLRSIATSMKILYAEKDFVKEDHIRRIAELVPRCSLARIGRCNHMTIFHKKETIESIKDYLRE